MRRRGAAELPARAARGEAAVHAGTGGRAARGEAGCTLELAAVQRTVRRRCTPEQVAVRRTVGNKKNRQRQKQRGQAGRWPLGATTRDRYSFEYEFVSVRQARLERHRRHAKDWIRIVDGLLSAHPRPRPRGSSASKARLTTSLMDNPFAAA